MLWCVSYTSLSTMFCILKAYITTVYIIIKDKRKSHPKKCNPAWFGI